jgi:hypothetical protein
MSYRGRMVNGVAVLETPGVIPDGTLVRVEVENKLADFWKAHSLEELAQEQGVRPLQSADELKGDWPEDESIDEFLQILREIRK